MKSWLDLLLVAVQLSAAGTGAVLYLASFLGYGWERGGEFIGPAFVALLLSTIPTVFRDHRFFKRYWGFGIFALRSRFPGEFYPAREQDWLNALGWGLFALIGFHFVLMIISSATGSKNWNEVSRVDGGCWRCYDSAWQDVSADGEARSLVDFSHGDSAGGFEGVGYWSGRVLYRSGAD